MLRIRNLDNTTENERRQSPRYALKTGVFLVFRPEFTKLGTLKDVSSGRVACEFAVFEKYGEVVDAEGDIFASEPVLLMLSCVPCGVVYDMKTGKPTLEGIETRRCGLKFEHLSQQQSELLNLLLIKCVSRALQSK